MKGKVSARTLSNVERWETHDNVVASRLLEHVGHQLCGYRRSTLVLFVLTCVGEERDDGGNSLCAGDLAGVDHDTELHQRGVDLAAAGVDDINVILADGLCDANVGFANAGFRDCGSGHGYAETVWER